MECVAPRSLANRYSFCGARYSFTESICKVFTLIYTTPTVGSYRSNGTGHLKYLLSIFRMLRADFFLWIYSGSGERFMLEVDLTAIQLHPVRIPCIHYQPFGTTRSDFAIVLSIWMVVHVPSALETRRPCELHDGRYIVKKVIVADRMNKVSPIQQIH